MPLTFLTIERLTSEFPDFDIIAKPRLGVGLTLQLVHPDGTTLDRELPIAELSDQRQVEWIVYKLHQDMLAKEKWVPSSHSGFSDLHDIPETLKTF